MHIDMFNCVCTICNIFRFFYYFFCCLVKLFCYLLSFFSPQFMRCLVSSVYWWSKDEYSLQTHYTSIRRLDCATRSGRFRCPTRNSGMWSDRTFAVQNRNAFNVFISETGDRVFRKWRTHIADNRRDEIYFLNILDV